MSKLLKEMSQEQLEWIAHQVVIAIRSGNEETKTKRALKEQTEYLERNILIPVGKEIKRRKENG